MENELVALEHVGKIGFDAHAVSGRTPRDLVEEAHLARAAVGFGEIHRRVCLAQQRFDARHVVLDARDTDAHRDIELLAAEIEGFGEGAPDALRDPLGRLSIADILAQDHELVTAEARQRVSGAQNVLQPVRDLFE